MYKLLSRLSFAIGVLLYIVAVTLAVPCFLLFVSFAVSYLGLGKTVFPYIEGSITAVFKLYGVASEGILAVIFVYPICIVVSVLGGTALFSLARRFHAKSFNSETTRQG